MSRESIIHNSNEMTGRNRTTLASSGCGDFTEKLVEETFFVCDQAHAQWPRAEHRTVYGIRPSTVRCQYGYGYPVTVTVQRPENFDTVRYGCQHGRITG